MERKGESGGVESTKEVERLEAVDLLDVRRCLLSETETGIFPGESQAGQRRHTGESHVSTVGIPN